MLDSLEDDVPTTIQHAVVYAVDLWRNFSPVIHTKKKLDRRWASILCQRRVGVVTTSPDHGTNQSVMISSAAYSAAGRKSKYLSRTQCASWVSGIWPHQKISPWWSNPALCARYLTCYRLSAFWPSQHTGSGVLCIAIPRSQNVVWATPESGMLPLSGVVCTTLWGMSHSRE